MNQTFDIVWRGYDRGQVDDYLRRLEQEPAGTLPPPRFDVVFRGYDRHQVERHLTRDETPDDDGEEFLGEFFGS